MKRSLKILLQLAFWMAYLLLVAIVMFAATQGEEMTDSDRLYYLCFVAGIGIIPPLISFYSHYYYLFPTYLKERKILTSVIFSLIISSVATTAGFLFVRLTNAEATNCIITGLPYAITFTIGLSTIFGIVSLVLRGFFTWYEELKLKEELMEKTHSMELELVKSQLDPHFLFNTINNIDVLIEKNPEEASRYLKKLSDIMRFMLYQTKGGTISLKEELDYIEKYIELQKIRTGNQHYVDYQLYGNPNGEQIAPMVFIPFIENAFKHSPNKKVDEAIKVNIEIEEAKVHFSCENKFDTRSSLNGKGNHGLGNELIKKRLELLYPENHQLLIDQSEDLYRVRLSIPYGKL